jgi:hypothetical protein
LPRLSPASAHQKVTGFGPSKGNNNKKQIRQSWRSQTGDNSTNCFAFSKKICYKTILPSKQFNMSEKGRAPARPALHRKGQSHAHYPVMRQKARQPNSQHKSYGRFRKRDGQAETKKKNATIGIEPRPPSIKAPRLNQLDYIGMSKAQRPARRRQ